MHDDAMMDVRDNAKLKTYCIDNNLSLCFSCKYIIYNSGYDVPYCQKLSDMGQGNPSSESCLSVETRDDKPPYKLYPGEYHNHYPATNIDTIPQNCEYYKEESK